MVIRFVGSDNSYQSFKLALLSVAKVTHADTEDINVDIYEVSSIKDLYAVPRTFKKPSFFYITIKDAALLSQIKEYAVSGIFFPPINPETVMAKIKKVASTETSRSQEEYDTLRIKILAKAESIPPLPALAEQLIRLTRSNASTIKDVCGKIKMDQGISSKVIKLINSPFYGIRQEISSIDRATVLLGFNSVKNIAAAICIQDFYSKPFNMYKTTGNALWEHSYKTACVAQLIGKYAGLDEEALYMAGLLHDVGKILMTDFLVKEVDNINDEKNQLGMTHSEAGALILKKWSVASDITEAVRNHHELSSDSMGKAVYYANKICNEIEIDDVINEMAITMDIKDIDQFTNKIMPLLTDINADV